jgi:hypothetical protein
VQVCGILKFIPNSKYFCTPLIMTLSMGLFMLFDMDFFLLCFLAWIYFLAYPILFFWHMKTLERLIKNEWSIYFLDGNACFCVTLSVRVSILSMGVRGSWSWMHDENLNKGHNNLTKLNVKISSIWLRFCIMEYCHMALVGIIIIWGAC